MPNPYTILGALGIWIGSLIGVYFYATHHEALAWKASLAHQQTEAADLRQKLTAANAAKDAAAADYARHLDEVQANAQKQIEADRDANTRDFSDKLQRIAASRPSCPSAGTAEAINAARVEDGARERKARLLEGIAERLARLGAGANELAFDVSEICVPWAHQVGR